MGFDLGQGQAVQQGGAASSSAPQISELAAEFRQCASEYCLHDAARIDEAEFLRLVRVGRFEAADDATAAHRQSCEKTCALVGQILRLTPSSEADIADQLEVMLWANGIRAPDLDRPLEDLDWELECAKRLRDHLRRFVLERQRQAA